MSSLRSPLKIQIFSMTNKYIPLKAAKQTALSHANLQENGLTALKISHSGQHHDAVYALKLEKQENTFEYRINAVSGEIISYSVTPNF